MRCTLAAAILALLLAPAALAAITIDGQRDADYGSAIVTQTTQTGMSKSQIIGDNNLNNVDEANGSELDGAYAVILDGVLYLFLSGNVAAVLNTSGNMTIGHVLDVFVDSDTLGQNRLQLGSGNALNGLIFDAPFAADHWFEFVSVEPGPSGSPPVWRVSYAPLNPCGCTLSTLGYATAGGDGTLSGGTNPHDVKVTIDNHNIAGVTFGCGASSGAGVATGIEWAIPLAAIGNPAGCFKISAFIRDMTIINGMGVATTNLSNQVLGPVVGCPLGNAANVNFNLIDGNQYFVVCPATVGVPPRASASGPMLGVLGSPARGNVRFAVAPGDASARLAIVDATGRVVRTLDVGAGTFARTVMWDGRDAAGATVRPGVYLARLAGVSGAAAARSFVLLR